MPFGATVRDSPGPVGRITSLFWIKSMASAQRPSGERYSDIPLPNRTAGEVVRAAKINRITRSARYTLLRKQDLATIIGDVADP
jgi:hypothetical protein